MKNVFCGLLVTLAAAQSAMAADYGKRFIIGCPVGDGSYNLTTPPLSAVRGSAHPQPGQGQSISIPDAWKLNASDARDVGSVKLQFITDHFDSNLNTPECYYEKNVRYVLNSNILATYSCFATLSNMFVCDKVAE